MWEPKVGETSVAICPTCKKKVKTTFQIRDIREEGVLVKDLLVGVCDECSTVVSIPHSSTPKIKEALDARSKEEVHI